MTTRLALSHEGLAEHDLGDLLARLTDAGATTEVRPIGDALLLVVSDETDPVVEAELLASDKLAKVVDGSVPHPLVDRRNRPDGTVVHLDGVTIGAGRPVIAAGPCSAESADVLVETARAVRASGASMFRVGLFKPRTSPYSFQGLGHEGLAVLREVRPDLAMPVVSEILDVRDVEAFVGTVDLLQVGARNMQNFPLLVELGRSGAPVLLKRGMSATVADWLNAAEYLLSHGTDQVVLCERGIRTFERSTRFTLDLNAVPVAKELSHLPVIVDPSHGTGARRLVRPMSAAALAAGADGVLVEVHPRPAMALSDGDQSLDPPGFDALVEHLGAIAGALGTTLEQAPAPALSGRA